MPASQLITVDGTAHPATPDSVRKILEEGARFWLDLSGLDDGAADEMLSGTFGFHPLAVEDARHFGQRPKIDDYDDFALLVAYGATAAGQLIEVHCFYNERYLVTVHREPCPDLEALGERIRKRPGAPLPHAMLLYRVLDTLVDGYFPVLSALDDRIDDLEDEILAQPTEGQMGQLFDMKRSLIALRKVVTPQRDMFAKLITGDDDLPAMTADAERYFRDLYDHLIRISDLVDSYRDLLSGALDTHLSTVSNRLNVVMKQLTIIATIFLPLSFLTGFFGQNFAWMVNRINSLAALIGLGIVLPVAVAGGLVWAFRRRGWLSSDGAVPGGTPPSRWRPGPDDRWRVLHPGPVRRQAARHPAGTPAPPGIETG